MTVTDLPNEYVMPPEIAECRAVRGIAHFTPVKREEFLWRMLAAADRGDQKTIDALLHGLRVYADGPPRYDRSTYTVYAAEEWDAEFGSEVTAPDAPERSAQ